MNQNNKMKLLKKATLFLGAFALCIGLLQMSAQAATIIKDVVITNMVEPQTGKAVSTDVSVPAGANYSIKSVLVQEYMPDLSEVTASVCSDPEAVDVMAIGKPKLTNFTNNRLYWVTYDLEVKDGYALDVNFTAHINGKSGSFCISGANSDGLIGNACAMLYLLDSNGKLHYLDESGNEQGTSAQSGSTSSQTGTTSGQTGTTSGQTSNGSKTDTSKAPAKQNTALSKVTLSKVNAGKKSFTAKWKKDANAKGYEVQYSLKSNFKSASKVTVKSGSKTTVTVKKLKSKKTYYVRVRSINGKKTGAWSKSVKVKVK